MFRFSRAILKLKFRRPSHRDVFEHRGEWADSRELQPPTLERSEVRYKKRAHTRLCLSHSEVRIDEGGRDSQGQP